jgi:hypothetical protein
MSTLTVVMTEELAAFLARDHGAAHRGPAPGVGQPGGATAPAIPR